MLPEGLDGGVTSIQHKGRTMDLSAGENLRGVVLVTGAARRLGAAIARELHGAGMQVVIHYRSSAAEAIALVEELNGLRADSAYGLRSDLETQTQIHTLAEQAQKRWGRLDALVNNASSYQRTPVGSIQEQTVDELVGSNFRAPLLLMQACAARFAEQGAIVNLIDTLAHHARPGYAPYNAAKAALWSVTETLAVELAPRVRVNAVAPGYILWADSDALDAGQQAGMVAQVPLQRMGRPADIARAVRFLLSPASSYMTGVILPVDGGVRLRA
jgi:pteridine reductase